MQTASVEPQSIFWGPPGPLGTPAEQVLWQEPLGTFFLLLLVAGDAGRAGFSPAGGVNCLIFPLAAAA